MEFFETVSGRHSYRGAFTDAPVPHADLTKIVEAGIKAPSAVNWQTTSFVIVNEPDVLDRIKALAPDSRVLGTCQAIIVVVMDGPEESPRPGAFFGFQDYAAAVENMLLAITALGYASVWTEGMLHREEDKGAHIVADLLGVPSPKRVRALLPVGVPAEPLVDRGRRPFDERAHWNHWAN
jgi:nitroreductase